VCGCPANSRVEHRIVRDTAPQEERQPRRQLEIADSVDAACRYFFGIRFHAKQERGVDEERAQRPPDTGLEIAAGLSRASGCESRGPSLAIKGHRPLEIRL